MRKPYLVPAQAQDGQEDVDDVHVEADGREDMLLRVDLILAPSHDLLGVVHQEHGEDEGNQAGVDGSKEGEPTGGEDDGRDAKQNDHPKSGVEVHTHA